MEKDDKPEDFLSQLGVGSALRALIRRTAKEFEDTGEWVSFDTLAYEEADGAAFDLKEVFKLPSVIGGAWTTERVNLTGLGLLLAGTAPKTTHLLTRLAGICGRRKQQLKDDAKISRQILVEEYGFSDIDARRAGDLVNMLPGISGGGSTGDDWWFSIFRGALDYRHVETAADLLSILQEEAETRLHQYEKAIAAAPAFSPGGMFAPVWSTPSGPAGESESPTPDDPSAVFVVHGRDSQARDAVFEFLRALGLHPLDWEDDLVAETGQGSPFIGQVLDAAFSRAQAVVVVMTPDDTVMLHPDLVSPGEQDFETTPQCQPRPNVLFEAGMAFGHCPSRTILVEIGSLRPVTDLGGRHTVRLGNEQTLRALARRLEAAGCQVDRDGEDWLDTSRFSALGARTRSTGPAIRRTL